MRLFLLRFLGQFHSPIFVIVVRERLIAHNVVVGSKRNLVYLFLRWFIRLIEIRVQINNVIRFLMLCLLFLHYITAYQLIGERSSSLDGLLLDDLEFVLLVLECLENRVEPCLLLFYLFLCDMVN